MGGERERERDRDDERSNRHFLFVPERMFLKSELFIQLCDHSLNNAAILPNIFSSVCSIFELIENKVQFVLSGVW